jgi:hypothetical protein
MLEVGRECQDFRETRAVGGRGLVLLTANLWFIFRWRLGGALREKDSTGLWMDQADRASARLTR